MINSQFKLFLDNKHHAHLGYNDEIDNLYPNIKFGYCHLICDAEISISIKREHIQNNIRNEIVLFSTAEYKYLFYLYDSFKINPTP